MFEFFDTAKDILEKQSDINGLKFHNGRISIITVLLLISIVSVCVILFSGCSKNFKSKTEPISISEGVSEDDFKEFYYTYYSTSYPPEFQRYRFYTEDGKCFFYHEKREGCEVNLTEEDITVHGVKELTGEEWQTFWDYMCKGTLNKESNDASEGNPGPWLYLYLNNGKTEYREFRFDYDGTLLSFEEFCLNLKESTID